MDAFFVPEGDRFAATAWTRGPWSDEAQHGGPPSALLARAIERALPPGMRVARLTVEFLRPVPVATLAVTASVSKGGRKVAWLDALAQVDGKDVCRATAVAVRTAPLSLPPPQLAWSLPAPDTLPEFHFPFFRDAHSYVGAMEMKIARGTFGSGAVAAWMRMRHPLVAGEVPSPLVRVAIAADSGNGVSAMLDTRKFIFMNPDLSIHLHRHPQGEWVCLDARTVPQPDGVGLAETDLADERGPIGRSQQALLLEERE